MNHQPHGQIHELFAYLCVSNASDAIRFYCSAFGGKEKFRLAEPGGRVGHAEVDLGNNITIMVAEEYPELAVVAPRPGAGTSVTLHLHVDNADALIDRAVAAGAHLVRPPRDEFYGERSGVIIDPFGHRWLIGHSIEVVAPEEMQARYSKLLGAE